MGKAPAFQFYVKDWLTDPQLKMASHSSKGIWIDLLAFMWQAPIRGQVTGTVEQITKMIGANNGDIETFLNEVNDLKFADVTFCNKKVTLRNRRMYREQQERDKTRKRVQKHRDKKASNGQSNAGVTPPSPSPTPSPITSSSKITPLYPPWLDLNLWQEFKKHRTKIKAPMTEEAERRMIIKLQKMIGKNGDSPTQDQILGQSIENGWKGIFPFKGEVNEPKESSRYLTDEEKLELWKRRKKK